MTWFILPVEDSFDGPKFNQKKSETDDKGIIRSFINDPLFIFRSSECAMCCLISQKQDVRNT